MLERAWRPWPLCGVQGRYGGKRLQWIKRCQYGFIQWPVRFSINICNELLIYLRFCLNLPRANESIIAQIYMSTSYILHVHVFRLSCWLTESTIPLCGEQRGVIAPWCTINSLWPSDTIWQQTSRAKLVQVPVMAWCLMAPSHYLNQCWFITWIKST